MEKILTAELTDSLDLAKRLLERDVQVTRNLQAARAEGRPDPVGGVTNGFRMRCRSCCVEAQVNLPHHAAKFMADHADCQEYSRPRL